MDWSSTPLLKTKLNMPPQRSNLILRPRLMLKLEQALQRQQHLILISAKAGSGKTSLVSEWVHRQDLPVSWISIDSGDNDPRRFCSYLIAALQQIHPNIGKSLLNQIETPQLPPAEMLLTGLINELASSPLPFLLVLDDYHLIQNDWIHEAIEYLVKHQPPGLVVIIITRVDPPFSLTLMRSRAQITEVRGEDLRFTTTETAKYLKDKMELDLSAAALAILDQRTEGWIVGLQMAAISMQGHKQSGDLTTFIESFGGTDRFVLDYLMEEVIEQQAEATKNFLFETAIFGRLSGALCDFVRGGLSGAESDLANLTAQNSQSILEQLERMNLFVIALDNERRWYRYHHLFADLLNSSLQQKRTPEEIRELHRRASLWYREHGNLEEAMTHTIVAEDYELAASMIDQYYASMFARSEVPVLMGWIEKLPEEIVRHRPWVDVYRAYTLALTSQTDETESLLDDIEGRIGPDAHRSSELRGHIAAIRAYTANLRGDSPRVIEMAALSRNDLAEPNLIAQAMGSYAEADIYIAGDDFESATRALQEMLSAGELKGGLMIVIHALCELASVRKVQGRLNQAEDLYTRAYQWMVERNGLESRLRCAYEFGLADLLRERNQLTSAHQHVMIGLEYRKRFGGYLVVGDLALMHILQDLGDMDGALEALRSTEQYMGSYDFQLSTRIEFNTARVIQWLAVGDVEAARRWAETCQGGSEREQVALARLAIAQGKIDTANALLDDQQKLAELGGRIGRLIEILALKALALRALGENNQAESILSQAIYLARPEGYRRIFLNLGWPLYELLEHTVNGFASGKSEIEPGSDMPGGYESSLIRSFQQEGDLQMVYGAATARSIQTDPLTERESEVLLLVMEGLSNKEIADQLVVAPSTIKQHLKNIFSKLDVHNRTQAVTRARELELL
jgi:LuxR family maltose regulon positive regulatory protein